MFSSFRYFTPKSFRFVVIPLLLCAGTFIPYLQTVCFFFFIFLECSVCLNCFILFRYLFSLPSFVSIFWLISLSCMVLLVELLFSFRPNIKSFSALLIFACCRFFLMCVSSRISHPAFGFLLSLLLLYSYESFSLADAFYGNYSNSISLQVSRTLLCILADLNYVVAWIVFNCSLIFMSSSSPLESIPRAQIIFGITAAFIFNNSLSSLARSRVLISFFAFFYFTLWSTGMAKSWIVLLIITRSGRLAAIRWSVCISTTPKSLSIIIIIIIIIINLE